MGKIIWVVLIVAAAFLAWQGGLLGFIASDLHHSYHSEVVGSQINVLADELVKHGYVHNDAGETWVWYLNRVDVFVDGVPVISDAPSDVQGFSKFTPSSKFSVVNCGDSSVNERKAWRSLDYLIEYANYDAIPQYSNVPVASVALANVPDGQHEVEVKIRAVDKVVSGSWSQREDDYCIGTNSVAREVSLKSNVLVLGGQIVSGTNEPAGFDLIAAIQGFIRSILAIIGVTV